MCANSNQDDLNIRLAALQTLQFFCELVEDTSQLSADDVCQVLGATVFNINPEQVELTKIAVKALKEMVPMVASNFSQLNQRDMIVQGLLKAAYMDDEECSQHACEAISELVLIGYNHLSAYLQSIGELTIYVI